MKSTIDEINVLHRNLGDLQNKINELYQAIGISGSIGRDAIEVLYRERIDLLNKDFDKIEARLKELVKKL